MQFGAFLATSVTEDVQLVFNLDRSLSGTENRRKSPCRIGSAALVWWTDWKCNLANKSLVESRVVTLACLTLYRMVMPIGTPFLKEKINN